MAPVVHVNSELLQDGATRIRIRDATEADMPSIYRFSKALAEMCGEAHFFTTTEVEMTTHLRESKFHALVVEDATKEVESSEKDLLGVALFAERYSSWSGPFLYLDDVIVEQSQRGKGIGTLLLRVLARITLKRNMKRLAWESVRTNEKANAFYEKTVRAGCVDDHSIWRLEGQELTSFAQENSG
eukprot:TRINITY_DN67413_c0_g1_i1.p1 TRINITY_DN67413_c0_g1~~TRINITY_DN67413_c0_g1_i1.p1  ORF type:complete len:185 (-),score=24.34 TRINITY_DN67413_c0_g1_i1:219-773(-)